MFSCAGTLSFYIFHRHRVCLVDRVDLICSLYSWWEGFRSSSSAALPLGLSCGFTSTAAYVSPQGFAPEAALEDLALSQGGPAVEGVQQLGLRGPWQGQVCPGIGFFSRAYQKIGVLSACGTTHVATSRISSGDRPHPEVRREGREPLADKAGESTHRT